MDYGHERHKERMASQLEQEAHEVNKSLTEESFLDITIKSKGSSTPKSNKKKEDPKDTKSKKSEVCSHYLRGRCKHGRIGGDCQWQHPKLCFAFIKNGDCKKEVCEFLHPKLCRNSLKKEICENEAKCKFFHIKTCRKKKEVKAEDREVVEKEIREKIEKEMKDKENKNKAASDKKEKTGNENSEKDFQQTGTKEPDILALLLSLQTQVEELSRDSKERKEREKYQAQFHWYPQPQYQQ